MVVFLLMVWTCSAATGTFECRWQAQAAEVHRTLDGCLAAKRAYPRANVACQPVVLQP